MVGECQTGKSALVKQLASDGTNFPKNYLMTHAAEVTVKAVNIPDTNDIVELYLLDCSGRDLYKEGLGSHLWNNCDMTVVVYDVTREDTFDAVHKVIRYITNHILYNSSLNEIIFL